MSIPKEPRQIMINLMYLVLTAMLALNVSSEILHAFKTINQSILSSNSSIQDKNAKIYASFDEQEAQPATRDNIKPFNDKAKQVKARTEDMMKYLDQWKERIIDRSGGYEEDGGKKEIKSESDIDASTALLVEANGGDTLKAKMEDLRKFFLSVVKPDDPTTFAKQLPLSIVEAEKTDNNPKGEWKIGYFQSMPVMAAVTLLSKFQNDIRNSEAMVLNQLNKEAGDTKINFDEIAAIAVPTNSYALAGQKVEAQIMIAAYNKSVKPEVTRSSGNITKVENGVAYWEGNASGVGLQTVKGQVTIDLGSQKVTRDYKFEYMVGSEGASMQLDKMNVFYIGVDNPVTVSAAGYSLEDVSISFPDGEVKPNTELGKGHYLIRSSKPSGVEGFKVGIVARTKGGGTKEVGAMKVRVKYIPDPVAEVAQQSGGYVSASKFRPQIGVVAQLKNFEFDARYVVTEFSYSVIKRRSPDLIGPYKVQGASWQSKAEIMGIQRDLKPGDKVFIEDIKAKGPDGRTRSLPPLSFTLT